MFETHAKAITPSPLDSDKGFLELDFVSQRFHAEWFYVSQHIRTNDGETSNRMLLIDDVDEFKSLLIARTQSAWIKEIYLVTPAGINKTGAWAIDLLLEVREMVSRSNSYNKCYIYKVDGTAEYYLSAGVDEKWQELPSRIIYSRKSVA